MVCGLLCYELNLYSFNHDYNFLSDIDSIEQFDSYVKKIVNQKFLNSFTTVHTFNETDQVLQTISYWPETSSVEYFRNKLKFQIQHSLFRYLDIVILFCGITFL